MADEVRETLKQWIAVDDEMRALKIQMKTLKDRKDVIGVRVMGFMRENNLDNFVIDGGAGTIARSETTRRVRPSKQVVRTQVAILLADQPERMAEVLRTMEGLPAPGQEPDQGSVITRELLTRRLPRALQINLA